VQNKQIAARVRRELRIWWLQQSIEDLLSGRRPVSFQKFLGGA